MNIEQIEDKAKNLIALYPDDLKDTLVAKLIQCAAFMRTHKPVTERIGRAYYVQAFVMVESFSDISKRRDCVTRIYLCMMVSIAMPPASGASQSWE